MTATFLPVERAFFGAGTSRLSEPICLMLCGLSTKRPRVQASMQRFGQTWPQTLAGKGLYSSTSASASSSRPCRMSDARLCDGMRDGQA